jgi:hypothetical protein
MAFFVKSDLHHELRHYPALKSKILNSPDLAFITEADVYSPCIGDVGSLPDKGEAGNNPNGTNAAFFTKISFGKNGAQTM